MHFAVCEIKNTSSFSCLAIPLILKFIANIDQLVIQLRYHFLIVNCRLEMIRSIYIVFLKNTNKTIFIRKVKNIFMCWAQNLKIIHSMSKYYVVILVLLTRMLVL